MTLSIKIDLLQNKFFILKENDPIPQTATHNIREKRIITRNKLAAIAGLTLTASMVLSEIAPVTAQASSVQVTEHAFFKNSINSNPGSSDHGTTGSQNSKDNSDSNKENTDLILNEDKTILTINGKNITKQKLDEKVGNNKATVSTIKITKNASFANEDSSLLNEYTNLTTLDLSETENLPNVSKIIVSAPNLNTIKIPSNFDITTTNLNKNLNDKTWYQIDNNENLVNYFNSTNWDKNSKYKISNPTTLKKITNENLSEKPEIKANVNGITYFIIGGKKIGDVITISTQPGDYHTDKEKFQVLIISSTEAKVIDPAGEGKITVSQWNLDENSGFLNITSGTLNNANFTKQLDSRKDKIKEIHISGKVKVEESAKELFKGLSNVENISGLENLDISNIPADSNMFKDDNKLNKVDLSKCDPSSLDKIISLFTKANITDLALPAQSDLKKINIIQANENWFKIEYAQNGDLQKITDAASISDETTKNITRFIKTSNNGVSTKINCEIPDGNKKPIPGVIDGEVGTKKEFTAPVTSGLTSTQSFSILITDKDKYSIIYPNLYSNHLSYTKNNPTIDPVSPSLPSSSSSGNTTSTSTPDHSTDSSTSTDTDTMTPHQVTNGQNLSKDKNSLAKKVSRLLSIFFHKNTIKLYDSNLNVSNRSLANGTDWFSDQEMVRDGETYYRISTNEWIKASDTYDYLVKDSVVTTKSGASRRLVNSRGEVSNRQLSGGTAWKSDRTIQLHGKTYYRVSSDEFISADDVTM